MMWMAPTTGLAALAKRDLPSPGDDIRMAGGKGKKDDQKKGNVLPAFMPGQKQALASQLNEGFGGGAGNWGDYLNMVYSPMKIRTFAPGFQPRNMVANVNMGDSSGNDVNPSPYGPTMRQWQQRPIGLLALGGK